MMAMDEDRGSHAAQGRQDLEVAARRHEPGHQRFQQPGETNGPQNTVCKVSKWMLSAHIELFHLLYRRPLPEKDGQ
jgi:hypothetical protein